jgi:hypothetical protein
MGRPTNEERQQILDRRKQAVALRLAGVDWETVADQCGYASAGAACTDLKRHREQTRAGIDESLEELRNQELGRLERLQLALWPRALNGDVRAAETVIKIIDKRVGLLGLNAPIRHEVFTIDEIDAELRQLREQYPQLAGLDPERDPG